MRRSSLWLALCLLVVGCSRHHSTPIAPLEPHCDQIRPIIARDYSPTWSPDGDSVAYIHTHRDSLDSNGIWIAGINGSPPRKVFESSDPLIGPLSWSPDGQKIAMCYYYEVWTLDLLTNELHQWTLGDVWTDVPEWLPDSRHILAMLPSGLTLIDTYTGSIRPIMRDSVTVLWSIGRTAIAADGSSLVTSQSFDGGNTTELYSVNLDGSNFRPVTSLGGTALNPQWSPDGQSLYFDFTPAPCFPEGSSLRSTWMLQGGRAKQSARNLGDTRAQFGFPFRVSQHTGQVAYVGVDSTGLGSYIWIENLDGTGRRQLTHLADGHTSTARVLSPPFHPLERGRYNRGAS